MIDEAPDGGSGRIKGRPVRVFSNQLQAAISPEKVDMRDYNGVSVSVMVNGVGPSGRLRLLGAPQPGGIYLPLSDQSADQSNIVANKIFDAAVGSCWLKAELVSLSGSFSEGQGFSAIITPYRAPGPTSILAVVS